LATTTQNASLLRVAAEYANYRRRVEQEKELNTSDAYAKLLTELLPTFDNIDRAMGYDDVQAIKDGLAIVLTSFKSALQKIGIEEIECEKFNPQFHTAMAHIEDPQYGEGAITKVMQKGYRRGDRVLRYAVVEVAN